MHACVNLRTVVGSGEPPLPSGRIRSSLLHLVDIKRRACAVPPSRPDVRPLAADVLLIEALAAEHFAVRGRRIACLVLDIALLPTVRLEHGIYAAQESPAFAIGVLEHDRNVLRAEELQAKLACLAELRKHEHAAEHSAAPEVRRLALQVESKFGNCRPRFC